jgi:hypothetical protein
MIKKKSTKKLFALITESEAERFNMSDMERNDSFGECMDKIPLESFVLESIDSEDGIGIAFNTTERSDYSVHFLSSFVDYFNKFVDYFNKEEKEILECEFVLTNRQLAKLVLVNQRAAEIIINATHVFKIEDGE